MSARKSKVKSIIMTAVIILLFILAVGMLGIMTNGFRTKPTLFAVETGDEVIVSEASELTVTPGTTFSVKTMKKDYAVKVEAKQAAKDFTYTSDGKQYSWNAEIAGRDMAAAFEVVKIGKTFTLKFGTVPEILEAVTGKAVTLDEAETKQDLFTLTITSGKSNVNISFTAVVPTEITLPDQIIF